jgi:hypothetical protein
MGAWQQINEGSAPNTAEIAGAGNEKGLIPSLDAVPAKEYPFLRWRGVFS